MSQSPTNGSQSRSNGRAPKGQPPNQVIQIGALKAAIWLNGSADGDHPRPYRTVSISKGFQQDGQWAEQKLSLVPDEVPTLGEILKEVMRRLLFLEATNGKDAPL